MTTSTSTPSSSMVPRDFVERFLERELDNTRRWLRDEVDLLVDSMFGQLKNKFNDSLLSELRQNYLSGEPSALSDDDNLGVDRNARISVFDSQILPPKPSTISIISIQNKPKRDLSNFLEVKLEEDDQEEKIQFIEPIFDNETDQPDSEFSNPRPNKRSRASTQQNSNSNSLPTLSGNQDHQNIIVNYEYSEEDLEFDEDCDCDSCNNFSIKQEQGPDFVTLEPSEDEHNNRSEDPNTSGRKQCELITEGLKCSFPSCDGLLFPDKLTLKDHIWTAHGTLPYRCYVRGCGQLFRDETLIRPHNVENHANLQQWDCCFCERILPSYKQLLHHYMRHHELGQFRCLDCDYTAQYRLDVYRHSEQHLPHNLHCPIPGCESTFVKPYYLKIHLRTHRNIRPYICRYPGCQTGYSSGNISNVVRHIRTQHFNLPRRKKDQTTVDDRDPKVYIQVVSELLNAEVAPTILDQE